MEDKHHPAGRRLSFAHAANSGDYVVDQGARCPSEWFPSSYFRAFFWMRALSISLTSCSSPVLCSWMRIAGFKRAFIPTRSHFFHPPIHCFLCGGLYWRKVQVSEAPDVEASLPRSWEGSLPPSYELRGTAGKRAEDPPIEMQRQIQISSTAPISRSLQPVPYSVLAWLVCTLFNPLPATRYPLYPTLHTIHYHNSPLISSLFSRWAYKSMFTKELSQKQALISQ